jgi:putative transposase
MDRHLDAAVDGPMHLRNEEIARTVAHSLKQGVDLGHYQLRAWVLMANHMHFLLLPSISPPRLLQALKGATARNANRILGRAGEPFWQAESYDHWVRDDDELERVAAYIENNPVRAGLAARREEYRWSSAFE